MTAPIKLSVAMCTFRGAEYLEEQLASISDQTRAPDELVVADDASSDRTQEILKSFAENAAFPVRLFFHTENMGSSKNFEFAISQTRGQTIALADQDDSWYPNKLEMLEKTLDSEPNAGLVFSNASMVDEHMHPLGYNLWDAIGLTDSDLALATIHPTDLLLKKFAVTGMTMAFRRSFLPLVYPIHPSWIHDGWIAFCLAGVGKLAVVDKPLVDYRQHALQQFGEKKRNLWQTYLRAKQLGTPHMLKHFEMYSAMLDHLKKKKQEWPIEDRLLEQLSEKVAHIAQRLRIRSRYWKRPGALAHWMNGGYERYSFGWKSMLQDLLA